MYSQRDEDLHVAEHAPENGMFLDIGAFDGFTFSNSLALIERGWSGVLVEPSLTGFQALLARHGGNEKLKLVHAAIGTSRSLVPFWDSPDAVSTTERDRAELWKEYGQFRSPYFTPQVTIYELLKSIPELSAISFLNIDTEGTSADLLLAFPFSHAKPKVICVEYDDKKEEILQLADLVGYSLAYTSEENLVLVLK
jgi:FkbM family methyltransferase